MPQKETDDIIWDMKEVGYEGVLENTNIVAAEVAQMARRLNTGWRTRT